MDAVISLSDSVEREEVLDLYRANRWSSAEKPEALLGALRESHSMVTARVGPALVGVGNAISDGHLVVYFPHMLVHPNYHGQGIGRGMMEALLSKYRGFHQLMLVTDSESLGFYERMGFVPAGKTVPMWIYAGREH